MEFTPGCFVKSITSPGSHILLTLCCMAIYLGYLLQSRKGGFASPVIFSDMTINQLTIYFSGNLATESATKEGLVRRFPTSCTRTPGWTRRSYKLLWKIERSGGWRCNNSSIKRRRHRQVAGTRKFRGLRGTAKLEQNRAKSRNLQFIAKIREILPVREIENFAL